MFLLSDGAVGWQGRNADDAYVCGNVDMFGGERPMVLAASIAASSTAV